MNLYREKTASEYLDFSRALFHPSEKETLLKTLKGLNIFSPEKRHTIEKHLPFFDKALLPVIDYLTIWDLLQLAGYDDHDAPLFAILLCMFDILQEGSLCLNLEIVSLKKRLQVFTYKDMASDLAENFLKGLENHKYDDFISRDQDDYKPLVFSETENRALLYFQKYYLSERKLQKKIDRILDLSDTGNNIGINKKIIHELIDNIFSEDLVLRISKNGAPIARDSYQVKAVRMALCSVFCIISGGPGTGKTSLMVNMLRCFMRMGTDISQIILCAPTGRAAQRMTEAIYKNIQTIRNPDENDTKLLNLKASTIHKVLHFKRSLNDFYYREQNPLPSSLIIMDEVSMVDVVLMEKFIRAIDPSRTRLVLLGDKDQLPSVEAGAVFGTMIPEGEQSKTLKNHLAVLKNTYRSGNQLQSLAVLINEGKSPPIEPVIFKDAMAMGNDLWAMVNPESIGQWKEDLILWACSYSDHAFQSLVISAGAMGPEELVQSPEGILILDSIFQMMESSKILTLIRQGIWGSIGINGFLGEHLSRQYGSLSDWQKLGIYSGALIIISKNDYSKALFNGDTGVIIQDHQGIFRAYFKRPDYYMGFSMDSLSAWEMSYALTVHKCQGSEFDNILIVLPDDEQHRLLTRQMIYTAVTRARKRVIIYGKPSSFNTALKRKIQRESGLRW